MGPFFPDFQVKINLRFSGKTLYVRYVTPILKKIAQNIVKVFENDKKCYIEVQSEVCYLLILLW